MSSIDDRIKTTWLCGDIVRDICASAIREALKKPENVAFLKRECGDYLYADAAVATRLHYKLDDALREYGRTIHYNAQNILNEEIDFDEYAKERERQDAINKAPLSEPDDYSDTDPEGF